MSDKGFVGYEYQEVAVKNGMTSVYADGYENFGWKLENSDMALGKPDSVVMRCKRDRKIRNKPELTRLQRQFDAIVSEIVSLESSKRLKASVAAYVVGIIGTAFMAGSTFAVTAQQPHILLCAILAVPGFIGWILPYFLYKRMAEAKAEEISPLIEEKYDEIYEICEKGNRLLHG